MVRTIYSTGQYLLVRENFTPILYIQFWANAMPAVVHHHGHVNNSIITNTNFTKSIWIENLYM
jgi:hypothetical protein